MGGCIFLINAKSWISPEKPFAKKTVRTSRTWKQFLKLKILAANNIQKLSNACGNPSKISTDDRQENSPEA